MNETKSPLLLLESPVKAGVLAFVVYSLFALQAGPVWRTTDFAYFNYLADAFLHGQLHLRLVPPNTHDLVQFHNLHYLYWPPFPAVLLMPFVALFGVRFSDVLFTLILAAVNVGVVAYFFRILASKGLANIDNFQRAVLVLFFAFGTVHFILARWGRVWFTSQIVAFTCGMLVYVIVLRFRGAAAFFLSGLLLSFAMLTRLHLVFLGIWPAYYLIANHKDAGWKRLLAYSALFLLPLGAALIFYADYNYLRFGNILENGTSFQDFGPFFSADLHKYGVYNIQYAPKNFYYNFIFYPLPISRETFYGGSLFLLSPIFFAAFWDILKCESRVSAWLLALTIFMTTLPILFIMGTGWATFGPRYTLDFTPPLLMLTGIGAAYWKRNVLLLLTAISIFHYFIGSVFVRFVP
jgi:hypothetical protein